MNKVTGFMRSHKVVTGLGFFFGVPVVISIILGSAGLLNQPAPVPASAPVAPVQATPAYTPYPWSSSAPAPSQAPVSAALWAIRAGQAFDHLTTLYTQTGADARSGNRAKTLTDIETIQTYLFGDEFNNIVDNAPATVKHDLSNFLVDAVLANNDLTVGLTDNDTVRLTTGTQELTTTSTDMMQVSSDLDALARAYKEGR